MLVQDLKTWRAALRLTQDQAAHVLGISRVAWGQREKGAVPLSQETRYALTYLTDHPEEVTARLRDYVKPG
ncbi:MAG: helix-turn-helix transcriptional regulator [Rhodospirillaceae bacterium]|nr:helix-turn-helix transcriptional regulator [Rhodospirillaceae bacterium]